MFEAASRFLQNSCLENAIRLHYYIRHQKLGTFCPTQDLSLIYLTGTLSIRKNKWLKIFADSLIVCQLYSLLRSTFERLPSRVFPQESTFKSLPSSLTKSLRLDEERVGYLASSYLDNFKLPGQCSTRIALARSFWARIDYPEDSILGKHANLALPFGVSYRPYRVIPASTCRVQKCRVSVDRCV